MVYAIVVTSCVVALRIDFATDGLYGVGEIDFGELASAQQKGMAKAGQHVGSRNVAASVDAIFFGGSSFWKINRAELASA